ncbi:MAG: alpha-amylase family glycosyl hydrolase [Actinomycetota bacterium]|nr:alpha-amylase family glycosyl hydrolase [Actinomycetota bacterium]
MPLEQRILDQLGKLYPNHDGRELLTQCKAALGESEPAIDSTKWSERDAVLICYPDQIVDEDQAPLAVLETIVQEMGEAFSTIHILPFYPSSSDGGFAVTDHHVVDEQFGSWANITSISSTHQVMADLVLNHVSSSHRWVEQFAADIEPGRSCLKTASPDDDVSAVVRPRTSDLLVPCETTAGTKYLWCTFGPDQVDVDWEEPEVLLEMLRVIDVLLLAGIRWFRLDAVAYVQKHVGTSCIHLEETHELVRLLRDLLTWRNPRAALITETNVPHDENLSYLRDGQQAHVAYNFTLAPLLTHALTVGASTKIADWLREAEQPPERTTLLNFLSSHDGIGLRPAEGILNEDEIQALVDASVQAKGTWSGRSHGDHILPYELNVSATSLLGVDRLLTAHTVLASLRGIPTFYLPAVDGEPNDIEAAEKQGDNRALNRPKRTVTARQAALIGKRKTARDELFRRLSVRREIPAFHPEATQQVMNLESPLLGIVRGDGASSVRVIANLGFTDMTLNVRDRSTDLLSGQEIYGELLIAPGDVFWLSTTSARS